MWKIFSNFVAFSEYLHYNLKFLFSKKATKIDEIFTVDLTLCSKCQIDGEDFVNLCGLLRKHELYYNFFFQLNCILLRSAGHNAFCLLPDPSGSGGLREKPQKRCQATQHQRMSECQRTRSHSKDTSRWRG